MTPEGYPDERELEQIREWPHEDFSGLVTFVQERWKNGSWREKLVVRDREYTRHRVATGGWSGNEALIQALRQNWVFWSLCWQASFTGGAYVFLVAANKEAT